ncbi:MAG: alpha/beta hydrolase [Rheinheimera sp.]|uniref:alpha/beta family hydrolase n=1 Tax=Arsukibacterium sp. UBA3155 TaxID=1946058 RepID=UPI000C9942FA|nr:alpha/beta family hydrolase [Arsukibacterium sp. UBA3155]MAD76806.1 alpha/beta hydrolase [Rheinheimera sp.]|tara:strand:+ start:86395 stop:87015 length:621 start_codon:yes stop_codon:yes gene_type:complete
MLLPLTNPKACLILAHGAGASCDSHYMNALAEALGAQNIQVQRFNFGYMQQSIELGRKRPPGKMTVLQQEFLAQIDMANASTPLFIGGKSMGGRVASMLSLSEVPRFKAIFAFGYPFHPPGNNSWRTEHFARLTAPLYIIQGERDPFGKRTELADLSWPEVRIHWLASADHDFKPTKASKLRQQQLIEQAAAYCSEVIDEILLVSQ